MPQPISESGHVAPRGHAQPPVVVVGALPFLGDKHVAGCRIIDEPRDDLAIALESDRDREDGKPCRKLVVPSSGSMNQEWLLSGPSIAAAFLHHEAVARPCPC